MLRHTAFTFHFDSPPVRPAFFHYIYSDHARVGSLWQADELLGARSCESKSPEVLQDNVCSLVRSITHLLFCRVFADNNPCAIMGGKLLLNVSLLDSTFR